jgi:hypothetical protein
MVDLATGEAPKDVAASDETKAAAAVATGKIGGAKGGRVRAERLTPEQRSEAARLAVSARWRKRD